MIKARFIKDGSQYRGLEVSGHAFFAEKGQDIVCAAVSALTTTGYNSLLQYMGQERISLKVDEKTGYMKYELSNLSQAELAQAEIILKTIEIGIDSIAQAYPGHITIR